MSWLRNSGVQQTAMVVSLCLFAGCETLYDAGVPGMERFVDLESKAQEEEQHRKKYLEDKDPEAIRWLLANRIQSGQTLEEVGRIFGEKGIREHNDNWLTTDGIGYRTDDKAYKWGPDREGKSIYLVFREGILVNFDPHEFEEPEIPDDFGE
jgi:hypothetical protein